MQQQRETEEEEAEKGREIRGNGTMLDAYHQRELNLVIAVKSTLGRKRVEVVGVKATESKKYA